MTRPGPPTLDPGTVAALRDAGVLTSPEDRAILRGHLLNVDADGIESVARVLRRLVLAHEDLDASAAHPRANSATLLQGAGAEGGPPCPRCAGADTARERNFGRVREDGRWWCMACGHLWWGQSPTISPAGGEVDAGAVHVWTDGACSGNPGPAGVGVVIVEGLRVTREIAEYLGEATSNIAELAAIRRGLEEIADRTRTVVVYSDSEYAIGVLSRGWRPRKNLEIIDRIRSLAQAFRDLRFVKVAAHAGVAHNERADQLATHAVARRGAR